MVKVLASKAAARACVSAQEALDGVILIDEPSISLSPLKAQETFALLTERRKKRVSILIIEQNARSALPMSDYGLVLEFGQTRIHGRAEAILNDPRVAQLFFGRRQQRRYTHIGNGYRRRRANASAKELVHPRPVKVARRYSPAPERLAQG